MRRALPITLALGALLACGGGGSSSSASAAAGLAYSDPSPAAGQWSLRRDPASSATHLILDLVPPADAQAGFGLAFSLSLPPTSATWSRVEAGDAELVQNQAYALGGGVQLLKSSSASGTLRAGLFQKGLATPPLPHSAGPVARIALDLAPGAAPGTLALVPSGTQELRSSGMQPITLAVGTLSAR